MKATEVKFTRRYNVGQYEHEEYTATAQLEDSDSVAGALTELKEDVQKAYSGVQTAIEEAAEEVTEQLKKKPGRKSKKKVEEPVEEEEIDPVDAEGDEDEEEIDPVDAEGDEDEEEIDPVDAEGDEDEDEEEVEEKPAKKTRSTAGAKVSEKKTLKKKAQEYQRTNDAHKDIFGSVLKKVAPNWKKSFESKAHAKKVSQKMEGKDFLDENGKVVATFEAEVKKLMGKFGK